MQVGCGFRVKPVKGREYVYFWHYEDRSGGRRQVYAYMGPQDAARTWHRLADAIEAYYRRASEELARDLTAHRAAVAAHRA